MKKLILFSLLFAVNANAAKYGMAGCGLGSLILEDKPGKVQIVSSLLNSWGSQTSAITSGTSNCTEGASIADLRYIEDNRQALETEVAQGHGETVAGLLQIWGCEESANQTLKENYADIFSTHNKAVIQVSNSMKQALKDETCTKI